jgi:hypothetical protein
MTDRSQRVPAVRHTDRYPASRSRGVTRAAEAPPAGPLVTPGSALQSL